MATSAGHDRADAARPGRLVDRLVIVVPYLWLLFFFLVPFLIVFKISLSQTAIAMPPYTPVFDLRRRFAASSTGCGS